MHRPPSRRRPDDWRSGLLSPSLSNPKYYRQPQPKALPAERFDVLPLKLGSIICPASFSTLKTATRSAMTKLPDIYTAQAEAISMSGEILRDMGAKFWNGTEWSLEVADRGGEVLFVLRCSAEERRALTPKVPD